MTDQWVFIEPQDVWMFRDNKPFAAGANFVARSIFPPHPQTIYGVLRTYYLNQVGVNWHDYKNEEAEKKYPLVGTPLQLGSLELKGLYVARCTDDRIEPLFPAPLDLVTHGKKDDHNRYYDVLHPQLQTTSDEQLKMIYSPVKKEGSNETWTPLPLSSKHKSKQTDDKEQEEQRYSETSGWLTTTGMKNYLANTPDTLTHPKFKRRHFDQTISLPAGIDQWQVQPAEAIYFDEGRIGLALDYGKRAHRESLFYRAEFLRLHPGKGLLLHLNEPVFETTIGTTGKIEIGGESRAGRFKVVDAPQLPEDATSDHIKLILVTPAYFEEGWKSKDWSQWVDGELVSAAIGKPINISGWDVAHNQPKPLRRYVPAGSVYYFKGKLKSPRIHLSDTEDARKMGFGQFIVGTWNE